MGGVGGGRDGRYGAKGLVTSYRSVDIRDWRRRGLIGGGKVKIARWQRARLPDSTIGVSVDAHQAVLRYPLQRGAESAQTMVQCVGLITTPCHQGGVRYWFACPGQQCGRRAVVLYLANGHFACRYCHALAYKTQSKNSFDRSLWRAQSIRMRLGGSANMTLPFPEKPKGMHWRTYERLQMRAGVADEQSLQGMEKWLESMKRAR